MPVHLLDQVREGKAVVFAGAGVSTEKRTVFEDTLYEVISHELGLAGGKQSFSELMTTYCERPDGRKKLIERIKERFDYLYAFPELYREATRFHHELSTLYLIQNIVTTNWDDFFERECGAVPFISANDFALWNIAGRKVFKIHGSINNLGSIVATTEDYQKCYKALSTGLMGSVLKQVLGTQTIVYIGYSFLDSDFRKIHKLLTTEMRGLRPHAYLVTLSLDDATKKFCESNNITPIVTDGAHFLARIKDHFVAEGMIMPDQIFDEVPLMLTKIKEAHRKISEIDLNKYPSNVYALAYQDGLIHSLERVLARRRTGEYSRFGEVNKRIHGYERGKRERLLQKNYFDAAYIDGYLNGLLWLVMPSSERRALPLYFLFGKFTYPRSLAIYRRTLKKAHQLHKVSFLKAKGLVQRKTKNVPGIVIHHSPFL